jgi:hypothetical protein
VSQETLSFADFLAATGRAEGPGAESKAPGTDVRPDTREAAAVLKKLQASIRRIEGERRPVDPRPLSSGCSSLDRLLPGSGFPRGSLVEWLADGEGAGAETLAFLAAREAIACDGTLIVMDRERRFYPPAAAALGIDLQRTLVVQARRPQEELWALDQALRCRGTAAVWARLDQLDWRWFRRLQLAVESGGGLGLLLRPARVLGQPSWSQVQLLVQPRVSHGPRRLHVEIARCPGVAAGRAVELEIDDLTGAVCAGKPMKKTAVVVSPTTVPPGSIADGPHETRPLSLAAKLAHPTSRRRSARA